MEMLNMPHLPEKRIKSLICGNNADVVKMLKNSGAEVLTITDDKRLPEQIKNHADIQCCHIGKGNILTTNTCLSDILEDYNVQVINEIPSDFYPMDCLLNCFVLNNVLIAGKNISKSVLEFAERYSIEVRFVNQGYAKCSTAIISETSIITADKTIAKALENDCNVLVIEQGYIKLYGYNYGFIGGSCGKISANEIVFAGNPYKHPSGRSIVSFAEQNECDVISMCNGELIDFGGFIPLHQ